MLKTIPVRAEIVVSTDGRNRTVYIAGPKEKASMTVYGDVPGEIIMRTAVAKGPESAYDGVSHLVLDTEAAQALCLELLERLGPFPALLERLGITPAEPEPAKAPANAAWAINIETYMAWRGKDLMEHGYAAKKGADNLFSVVLGTCAPEDAAEQSKAAWQEFAWVRDALRVATGWGQEIIVHGNVSDGFSFIGPFLSSGGAAKEFAERNIRDDWNIVVLTAPEDRES